ncbi:MAG: hypothetical protein ABI574_08490 [Burkholderiales bacterium]
MDFIERLFGISPDGGSGWFEFLLFAIPLAGVAWLWRRRRAQQQRRSGTDASPARGPRDPR